MPITTKRFDVLERTSVRYTAKLVDDNGDAISVNNLTAITLTVYDKKTGNILNSRDEQDVLNTNNVTITTAGDVEWIIQPADIAIVNANLVNETHIALFEWTWNSGTRVGKQEIELAVKNLTKVP